MIRQAPMAVLLVVASEAHAAVEVVVDTSNVEMLAWVEKAATERDS